jgi:diacylglycerol kinase (ATP)
MSQVPLGMKTIDVGRFHDRYFITGISLGFGADLVKGANRESKNRFGILAYFLSAAAALAKTRKAVYHLNIDGREYGVQGLMCITTNVGNLGFSKISLDKHIDVSDGYLDVVVVRKANFNLFKHIAITLINGERPYNLALVQHWHGKDISVSSTPKQTIQCDGQISKEMPLHINVIPGAIKVLVLNNKSNVIE